MLGITLSAVRDPQGSGLGVACLTSDLTEISDLARQMRLRENLASLGEMSAGIAHEFKNSLATISGYAQMLQNEKDAGVTANFAAKIAGETSNLTRVVTDFLNFARPQDSAGLTESNSEALPLADLLRESAQSCDLDLDLQVPAELKIMGDLTAWRQAFSNLLRNSAEAAHSGVRAKVRISAEQQDSQLIIKITDNGCGIPKEQLDKIFIPFFTTKDHGTGLGLALVHRIVSRHGGAIKATSSGQGTEFVISLPARAGQQSARA